ncbi:BBP7 family outer membrane beta-barrel protein [Stieleria varia]|nr:BBP7 family outer membrane beta-barrel protein [Stieleria varia]
MHDSFQCRTRVLGYTVGFGRISLCLALAILASLTSNVQAQVRGKAPDRGTYQPPVIVKQTTQRQGLPKPVSLAELDEQQSSSRPVRPDSNEIGSVRHVVDLQEVDQDSAGGLRPIGQSSGVVNLAMPPAPVRSRQTASQEHQPGQANAQHAKSVQPVNHQRIDMRQLAPQHQPLQDPGHVQSCSCESCSGGQAVSGHAISGQASGGWVEAPVVSSEHYGPTMCDASGGCDTIGCDSIGCNCGRCSQGWAPATLSFCPDRWFGSIELLHMARKGDRLPALVTTGPDTDSDTAGELNVAGTRSLVGNDAYLRDGQPGGRLTLGTWLNQYQSRSLVFRGWASGEETYDFNANQDSFSVLARPFFNVTDGQTAAQDTQLIVFPELANGDISVHMDSSVYGGDASIRQMWYCGYGGSVDLLYGYQYMRLDESLSIDTRSTSLSDDFAPLGSVLAVRDSFGVENEFHGGQLGIASRYREGCWSFSGLAKVGFGSLSRRAELSGGTTTSIDGISAFDPNGLLVRSTNAGTRTDSTFAWVPELDFSIGYQWFRRCDVTFGYHIVALTDALQVSGTIDPNLASNLASPPTGQQRPQARMSYDTFYVQGVHLGLSYIY